MWSLSTTSRAPAGGGSNSRPLAVRLLDESYPWLHIAAAADQLSQGYNGALAIAVVVVLFWNFFSNRFITYSDVKIGH